MMLEEKGYLELSAFVIKETTLNLKGTLPEVEKCCFHGA